MTSKEEKDKAAERGQELTPAEIALEDAREDWHKKKDEETKAVFKAAQQAVNAERVASRHTREAEPVPAGATEIRDATGKVYGWTTPAGDAVSAQGGRAG